MTHKIIFEENDLITADNFLSFCKKNDISYAKTDYFYTWNYIHYQNNDGKIFWRDEYHPKNLEKFCVIGHSDFPVTSSIVEMFDFVFCINKENSKDNCEPIPLGLCNFTNESDKHLIYGDKGILLKIMNDSSIKKKNLSYMNFSFSTFPNERVFVYEKFKSADWVQTKQPEQSLEGREKYLIELKESKFVFCPRGNGVDTHRIWESLYMGSIPIVITHKTHENLTDLPILFINSWEEISQNFLEKKYEEFSTKEFNLSKLKQSYWNNLILEKKKKMYEK